MGSIFGNKLQLEPQWKKLYKPRVPKRGTSELLRKVDTELKPQSYDRTAMSKEVTGDTPKRLLKDLADAAGAVRKQQAKFKDWSAQEKAFLVRLVTELEAEAKFWESYKPTPPPKPARAPVPAHADNPDIIRTGDQIEIKIASPVLIPALAKPSQLLGSASDTLLDGKPACVLGDELPRALTVPMAYTAPPYLMPGMGMLSVQLDNRNVGAKSVGGKPMLLKGNTFQAIFKVTTPAMQPGPAGRIPDPISVKSGICRFVTRR